MTLMQIQIAVAVARSHSVSTAAEQLGVSQPNASNAIRNIEKELGVDLFHRTGRGLTLTEQGYRFLDHASGLLREYNTLTELGNTEPTFFLRLGVTNYAPLVNAFLRLCAELDGSGKPQLSYHNLSVNTGSSMLMDNKLDIVGCVVPVNYLNQMAKMMEESRIAAISVCPLRVSVKLREGHPVLRSGLDRDINELLWDLREYPYVDYQTLNSLEEIREYRILPNLLYSYRINVDERDTRMTLLQKTNAFSVGSESSKGMLKRYGLTQIPVPDVEVKLLLLVRKGEENRREVVSYLRHLRDELTDAPWPEVDKKAEE